MSRALCSETVVGSMSRRGDLKSSDEIAADFLMFVALPEGSAVLDFLLNGSP